MLSLAGIFGITNSGISLAITLVLFFLGVIWLALVYWTYADGRRRIADNLIVACAAMASFIFPFVGTIVYMIVRPPEYLDDVRERELEMQAAEARLAELGFHLCPHCDHEVERDFLRCPHCMRKLKDPCQNCGKPLDPGWRVCPYCEAEIGTYAAGPRRARRRRDGAVEQPVAAAPVGAGTVRAERAGAPANPRPERSGAPAGARAERPSAPAGPRPERGGAPAPASGTPAAARSERAGAPAPAPAPIERGGSPAT